MIWMYISKDLDAAFYASNSSVVSKSNEQHSSTTIIKVKENIDTVNFYN